MISSKLKLYAAILLAVSLSFQASAQSADHPAQFAFPLLLIAPDARSAAMGEVGAATSPDANAAHYNPSKLAFVNHVSAISASYVPWLRSTVSDIGLSYLSGYRKINDKYTLAASFRYFSMGKIDLTDQDGTSVGVYSPNEFAFDATLAKKFGENFSLATTLRYIHGSSAASASFGNTLATNAVAVDVSAYLKKKTTIFQKDAVLSYGLSLSNIGTKVSYAKNGPKYFLPGNLKIGAASAFTLDDKNKFTLALDLNKLMVPNNSDLSVPSGIFNAFSDAGKQITYALGSEYEFDHVFLLRVGYFYEQPDQGNRQYFTTGAGFVYKQLAFDFAYLFGNKQKSAVANTLRFSLHYNIQ